MKRRFAVVLVVFVSFVLSLPGLAGSRLQLRETLETIVRLRRPAIVVAVEPGAREAAPARIRRRFGEGWKVLFLEDLPPEERETRLGRGFILVATAAGGGDVLEKMLARSGVAITDAEHVTVNGTTFEARDPRVVFVAENPWGPGPALVLAGRTLEGAVRLADWLYNGVSGYVFDGDVMLDRLEYTDEFAPFPREIPLDQALADVATCFAKIVEIHPDPLHALTPGEWIAMRRDTIRRVVAAARRNDGRVRVEELAAALQRAVARLRDGHTAIFGAVGETLASAGDTRFPPFVETFDNGRWIVRGVVGKENRDLLGATIEEVNGQSWTEFLAPVLAMISGETLPYKAMQLVGGNPSGWWMMSGRLADIRELECRFRTREGVTVERSLPVVGFREYERMLAAFPPPSAAIGAANHRFVDDGRICVFRFPSFEYDRESTAGIDRLFRELEERGTKVLVMDIRGNVGGDSRIAEYIVSYLTDRPFRAFSSVTQRITPDVLARRESFWTPAELDEKRELLGLTITEEVPLEEPPPREHRFRGRFILLTDNRCFSTASDFAAIVKGFHLGTIVGRETGGVPSSFGDVIYLTLPYSRIGLGVSHKWFAGPVPGPGDDLRGVQPDIAVDDALLARYRDADDPVLALALDIARHGPEAVASPGRPPRPASSPGPAEAGGGVTSPPGR